MAKETQSFEEKMITLENIIKELEEGNISLDDSINKYMDAMKLIKECDEKLKKVEEQINKIVNEDGELVPFEVKEN